MGFFAEGTRLATLLMAALLAMSSLQAGEPLRIAAASDLRYALDDIVTLYRQGQPQANIQVIYGSSGKLTTQISNGAPYDIFFAADIRYPQQLEQRGLSATTPVVYATGRIVVWSKQLDASQLSLQDLDAAAIRRIAIAQPAHAPYGLRAKEALQSVGMWQRVQDKLVFGENIAHTAQMAQSGAAQVGIIALSLARSPALSAHGHHLIDEALHSPLQQAHIITRRGANKAQAQHFIDFVASDAARAIMSRYGFRVAPGEPRSTP